MTFATPIILIGLIAAGIPLLLHLISSVRAREEQFPTLRFLRLSMEKTARRRKLQNWLLLLLRSLLLAVLAMAVAEPILRTQTGWLGPEDQVAVLILDDSYSMAAGAKGNPTRFSRAKTDAADLLSGDNKPAQATLTTTTSQLATAPLTTQLDALRKSVASARVGYGDSSLSQKFAQAVEILNGQSNPSRVVYIFSDLQRVSFQPLLELAELVRAKGFHIFIMNYADQDVNNVGITDLTVTGQAVIDGKVKFVASIRNSSPGPRRVEVIFTPEGQPGPGSQPQRVIKNLAAAGESGDSERVEFWQRFAKAGPATGEVRLGQDDDLQIDNVRRFCVNVQPRVKVLVVNGQENVAQSPPAVGSNTLAPAAMLELALDWRDESQQNSPWPINLNTTDATDLTPDMFDGKNKAVFFCDVPSFTPALAKLLGQFVRRGGSAVFFLGQGIDIENYNEQLGQTGSGLLPGRLSPAVGQVGPDAPAVAAESMNISHPLLANLFDDRAEYPTVLVQRYFKFFIDQSLSDEILMTLANDDPLIIERRIGAGRVLWCAMPASPRWSNLPMANVFPPMMIRFALQAGETQESDEMYIAAQPAILDTTNGGNAKKVQITLPNSPGNSAKIVQLVINKTDIAKFQDTNEPGLYRWDFLGSDNVLETGGAFVVNPAGHESNLAAYSPEELSAALRANGLENVHIGPSLQSVQVSAADKAQGRNLWDVLITAVILLLVIEAVFANRRKAQENN